MTDRAKLLDVLRRTTAELPDTVEKKMFGCEAMFTAGGIFALIWKTGRIAVKLPVAERHDALMAQKGASPWMAGPKTMTNWVLVPPALESSKALLPWLREAHAMSLARLDGKPAKKKIAAPKKAAAAKKNVAAKNNVAKKTAARRG